MIVHTIQHLEPLASMSPKWTPYYEFKPVGAPLQRYIQKFCWWILTKFKAIQDHWMIDKTITFHRFSDEDLFFALRKQKLILEQIMYHKPKNLIISETEFNKLVNSPSFQKYFSFDTKFKYGVGVIPGYNFFNLKVHVVPWIEGWVII